MEILLEAVQLPPELRAVNEASADEASRRQHFYAVMEGHKGVEFIDGKVVKQSPVEWRHTDAVGLLSILLSVCVDRRGLGKAGLGGLLITLTRNDYEPDVSFFGPEEAAAFTPDQLNFPAPDLVAEVLSPLTEHLDRGIKKHDYAAHGVSECWIVDPVRQTIEQHKLDGEKYRLLGGWKRGDSIASVVVPGFRIPVRVVFDHDANLLLSIFARLRNLCCAGCHEIPITHPPGLPPRDL